MIFTTKRAIKKTLKTRKVIVASVLDFTKTPKKSYGTRLYEVLGDGMYLGLGVKEGAKYEDLARILGIEGQSWTL